MPTRLERMTARRTDDLVSGAKLQNEIYKRLSNSESVRYALGAMQPIDPEYTKNTYEQGDRVCNQLKKRLSTACDYEYQGSVTNDTHIKARSDIDVLVLTQKFWMLEHPQKPSHPYTGVPLQDLIDLRSDAISCLKAAFPEADVDSSGSKSIMIEGGSLRRKIDVVPSNWFHSNKYVENKDKIFRAVEILDAKAPERVKNTPFLHNALIDLKDKETNGGLRKAARLMKSLKYDNEDVDLSSYDIVSIAFNIPSAQLTVPHGSELLLLDACRDFCVQLMRDGGLRVAVKVPDGHRAIFADGHATDRGLAELAVQLQGLVNDVLKENERSFKKLSEARVEYYDVSV